MSTILQVLILVGVIAVMITFVSGYFGQKNHPEDAKRIAGLNILSAGILMAMVYVSLGVML